MTIQVSEYSEMTGFKGAYPQGIFLSLSGEQA